MMRSPTARPGLFALVTVIAALMIPRCGLAEVAAELSAARVASGQAVILTLSQTGATASTPDLAPLQRDFQIIERSTIEDVRIVNGQRREQRQLRLTLLPRGTGTLTVPPIQIGDETTPALPLTVTLSAAGESRPLQAPTGAIARDPAQTAPPAASISVRARIEPERVAVRQQALLVVEVTSADGPPTGRLLAPEFADTRVLPLGEERRVEPDGAGGLAADQPSNRGGSLHVYEQRFALFPGKAGSIDIPPLQFDVWQPSGGSPVPVRSAPLRLEVGPIPDGVAKQDWLPARALSLTEAGPSEVRIAPGQTLERMITLRADGLMAEDLPVIPLAIPFQLRIRDDPPRLWNERNPDGVVGYRSERILIGSANEGNFLMKGPVIDWWDTRRGAPARASLPDWTLTVAPYQSADHRPAAVWGKRTQPEPQAEQSAQLKAEQGGQDGGTALWRQPWPWLLGAAVLLVMGGLLLRVRLRARRRPGGADSSAPSKAARHDATPPEDRHEDAEQDPVAAAIDAVEQAYRSGNSGAARQALLDWAALLWPERTPANLAQLAARVESPLREDVLLLEKAFFSPTPLNWMRADMRDKLTAASQHQADAAAPA
jgi:hypothetical protein